MVEDQPVDSEMAVRALKKNNIDFEFIRVETESSFITALNEFNPDIIISDYSMPMFDGMRALKLAKEIRPELPFIVLTGSINEETAVECMKAGANDYILKDNMTRLPYAVIDAIKNFENQKQKQLVELSLDESEKRYKALFQNNHAVMLLVNPENGQIVDANPAACGFYGWSHEELVKMSMHDFSKLTKDELANIFIKAMSEETSMFLMEHSIANGQKRFVDVYSGPINVSGKSLLYSIIHDVTNRVKAEEEIKILAHAIKSINDCVSVTDLNNNIIFVNDSFIKTYGYNWDELFGKKIDLIWSLKSPEGVHSKVLEDTIKGSFQGELWNKRKDGSEFQISLSTSPIFDENGKIRALVGISNDITKRKFDENVQHILHEIARTFMTNITIEDLLILVRNELSKVIDTSNFFVATYNSETELLKKVIFIDEKDDFIEWKAENSLSGQVVKEGKTLLINEDQRNIFAAEHKLELKGSPAKCWLGVPIIVNKKSTGVIVLQSYTNKNAFDRSSAQLLELIAHEIAIVFERKEMILHLIEAKEKAEESDRLKTAFLANISHEIRTPMNGILGFSDMLARDNLDIEKREMFIEIIRKSGNQLLSIIDDIIDISKIETEQIRVVKEIFDLNEVMDYTFALFKPQFDQLNLEFQYIPDCKNKTCIVESDKVRIQQIITNLLNNALKFTHSGFVKFGYAFIDNYVKIFVKDSGIGISTEHEGIIFERFRQVDEGSSRNYGGTGLGLSISKALVEKLGGTIWFESVPNEGSTFYFTIPAKIFDSNLENPDIELLSKNEILLNNEITILIVDDEKMNYLYLKEIIDFLNIKNIYASNGMEAIELVEKHPEISLILMDIKMPVMNGYISTKKIKKLRPKLPIIAQTAYAQQGDREKALNAGCDDYISKPIKETELISLIKKVLNK